MPLLHFVILQVMKNVNTDPNIFHLGRVFPQHVVVWSGRRGRDLIYNISRALQSAGAYSDHASDETPLSSISPGLQLVDREKGETLTQFLKILADTCSNSIQKQQHFIKAIVCWDRLGLASLCLLERAFCIVRPVSKSRGTSGAENLRHTRKSMELTLLTRFPLCLATAPVGPWEFSVVGSLVPWQKQNAGCLACCWTCNLQPSNSKRWSQVNSRLGRGLFARADFLCHLQKGILQPGRVILGSASPRMCCLSALLVQNPVPLLTDSGDIRWLFSRLVIGSLKSKNVQPQNMHCKARCCKCFFPKLLTKAELSHIPGILCNTILFFWHHSY